MRKLFNTVGLILGIFQLGPPPAFASKIGQVCPRVRKLVRPDFTPEATRKNLESMKNAYRDLPDVVRDANQLLQKMNSCDFETLSKKLADKITQASRAAAVAKTPTTPLSVGVDDLYRKYSSLEARQADPQAYIQSLRELLKSSKNGARITSCFEKTLEGSGFEPGVQFLTSSELSSTYGISTKGAAMSYLGLKGENHKRKKTIVFSADDPPLQALFDLAHEMQHGCDAPELALNADAFSIAKSTQPPDLAHARTIYDQNLVVLEARGYLAAELTFKEIAEANPGLLCTEAFVSEFHHGSVVSLPEYYSFIENHLESGEFSYTQALNYVKLNMYDFNSLFEWRAGLPVMRQELSTRLHREVPDFLEELDVQLHRQ